MLTLNSRLDCLGISPHHRKPFTALPTDTVLPRSTCRDPLHIDQANSPGRSADLRGSRELIGCMHPKLAQRPPLPRLLRSAAVPQWWLACRGERSRFVGMLSSKNVPQIELVLYVRELMVTNCNRSKCDSQFMAGSGLSQDSLIAVAGLVKANPMVLPFRPLPP